MALQLLKLLLNHALFQKYGELVQFLFEDSKELKHLYNGLVRQHEKYQRDITLVEYSLNVLVNCQEKDKETFQELLNELKNIDDSSLVLDELLETVLQRQQAHDLALLALEVSEGRKEFNDLVVASAKLTEALSTETKDEFKFVTTKATEIAKRRESTPGLTWRLGCLNKMYGPIRRSNFMMVVARSNVGKTSWLASEVSHMATQTDKPILWFNLEQDGFDVSERIMQAGLGITHQQLLADPVGVEKQFDELYGDRIKIYDDATTTKRQVERVLAALKPGLIIFDTIDKIKGFDADREDLRLGEIYIWGRELCKQYAPVITVCQASGSADGKKWLTSDDISNSKTSKIAECDAVLCIGKSHDLAHERTRFFHSIKNKLPDAEPEHRHGRFEVELDQETGRYTDMEY